MSVVWRPERLPTDTYIIDARSCRPAMTDVLFAPGHLSYEIPDRSRSYPTVAMLTTAWYDAPGVAPMAMSASSGKSFECPQHQASNGQIEVSIALQSLAAVTQALAALPADADDAALLQAIGAAMVPAFGDLCLLHALDRTGQLRMIGVEPPDTQQAQQLVSVLEQQSASMVVYEPLLDEARPLAVSASTDDASEHVRLLRAAGLSSEIVIPLHAGAEGSSSTVDALLILDRIAADRAAGADDLLLAEILGALVSNARTVRELCQRETSLGQRIDEMVRAGRELAHLLNNNLTLPVGAMELLIDRGALSADLNEMMQAAASDLAALEDHVRQFQEQMRLQAGVQPGAASEPWNRHRPGS